MFEKAFKTTWKGWLLPGFVFFLHLAGYSQSMNHIRHLQKILALDARQLSQLDQPAAELVFIPSGESCFLGTSMALLPDQLNQDLLPEVFFQPLGSEKGQKYKNIIRLIQEDTHTKRLDFYSRQLNYSAQETDDSLIVQQIKEQIRNGLLPYHWLEQPSDNSSFLHFRNGALEMTVMLETLADVEHFPFWRQLNNNFHIHRPSGYTPALSRFAHFVIRTS